MKRILILGALALGLVACGGEEGMEPVEGTGGDTAATVTEAPITPDLVKLAVEDPIAVSIGNDGIEVDAEALPGATQFQVTNDSDQVRTLVVEGPAVRASLEAPLQPLEIRTITVDLQSGTYRLVSPATEGGAELSAEVNVVVPEQAATGT